MFGFMNGMMASAQGWRVLQDRDVIEMHPGAAGIVVLVLGLILWALAVTALVLAIVLMIRRLRRPGATPMAAAWPVTSPAPAAPVEPPAEMAAVPPAGTIPPASEAGASASALQILNDRFVRGEIAQEEYIERRKALLGG